jgi:AcrR family transcriptional regulator
VPFREIARRAQVGPATVYRHFPTKEALLAEAFVEQMARCSALVEEGLSAGDPWSGFCLVIDSSCRCMPSIEASRGGAQVK